MSESTLVSISNCDNADRIADVIFVHGLGGNALGTWHPNGNIHDDKFWLSWLGDDIKNIAIWSLSYEVEPFLWRGQTMPLVDRATNVLAVLDSFNIGQFPLFFVTHSLGGLLVKQMLRHANDFGTPKWKNILRETEGIVFLSTPHSGADIANWLKYIGGILGATVSVQELQANDSRLRELNQVFRNQEKLRGIPIQVYCEKRKTSGILVVDETSADPGIPGVIPIPMDFDHISICKPDSKDSLIYRRVKQFIEENLKKK
jgi:pimeloyl-ACP methyl ester carboxylesterase